MKRAGVLKFVAGAALVLTVLVSGCGRIVSGPDITAIKETGQPDRTEESTELTANAPTPQSTAVPLTPSAPQSDTLIANSETPGTLLPAAHTYTAQPSDVPTLTATPPAAPALTATVRPATAQPSGTPVPGTAVPVTAAPKTEAPATPVPATLPPEDTFSPIFINFKDTLTLEPGSSFDVHKYVSYIDDVDPEVELNVEGSLDTAKEGEYRLKVTVSDDAGNTRSRTMTVRVAAPDPDHTPGPATPKTPETFAEFIRNYKKNGTMVGIDVSRWQEDVDFEKVAAAGCEFVIIRIGGYSGSLFTDRYYRANIKNAKKAGLKVGVYWYSEENGPDAVRKNASYLYGLLDGEQLDFPIFFDWEDYINFEKYKMSMRDFNDMFLAFREEAEKRGYKAALYNSKYYLEFLWYDEVLEGGVWVANYVKQTDYAGRYFMWQHGQGVIDGINGEVDLNVFYPDVMD